MTAKIKRSFGLTAFFSMITDGRERVVTAIIKDRTTPNWAPFESSASATGMVPKISAYIGIPAGTAIKMPKGFPFPRIFIIKVSGIQL